MEMGCDHEGQTDQVEEGCDRVDDKEGRQGVSGAGRETVVAIAAASE